MKSIGLDIDELLELEDTELERKFHAGNPAYTDTRMAVLLSERLSVPHVIRHLVWQEYQSRHADSYCKSLFIFHLRQNLIAGKSASEAVHTESYSSLETNMVHG